MSQKQFKKFINPKKNNAAIKEKFKQEKKLAKKERAAAIDKRFAEKRALRYGPQREEENRQGARGNRQGASGEKRVASSEKRVASGDKRVASSEWRVASSDKRVSSSERRVASGDKRVAGDETRNGNEKSFAAMPLNKFIAHCGVSSRRDAIPFITEGKISVNGAIVLEPGFKITNSDVVMYNGKKLFVTKNQVYILLNKPKDYITTTDDPQGRKTVLQLIKNATNERVYPVGRLDRNTSGVLILTNDGELTQKLTHPSYNVKKVYEVKLDKPVTKAHFEQIVNGINLDDGEIHADALAYADAKDKSIIGIEIHSGRNRIVRRIFEHFGYDVKGLDRVMYADLTKKNVERGKWRYLSDKEIRLLKYTSPNRIALKRKEKEIQSDHE
ncbi:MAG: rRNA pseudouridine synthase [Chitinophagaceae bacterium]|nr:rRNA pseudouridine synthase [Chitinophagaceae bacterium]